MTPRDNRPTGDAALLALAILVAVLGWIELDRYVDREYWNQMREWRRGP